MIPPLDAVTDQLPPGRYRCTLDEIYERFVDAPEFSHSSTRVDRFDGLVAYLHDWRTAQSAFGGDPVLMGLWVGGSFISSVLDPQDIDVTPHISGPRLRELEGKPGVGRLKRLFEHRKSVRARYLVEPFPFTWYPVAAPFGRGGSAVEFDYYTNRGIMDDFWQRVRPPGPKVAPTLEDAPSRRGYLEVIL